MSAARRRKKKRKALAAFGPMTRWRIRWRQATASLYVNGALVSSS